jgi:indolepyruvate ferredoxin oxidoreductase
VQQGLLVREGLLPVLPDHHAEPGARAADGKKKKKGRIPALERELPDPSTRSTRHNFGIHVMGIGGTGSVTVVATIANAARLEGKHVIGLDQTGLAQKGGTVISDIKITHAQFDGSNKISDGRTDLYLGFDILNATDPKNLDKCHPERTIAMVSTTRRRPARWCPTVTTVPGIDRLTAGIDRVTRKERQRLPRRQAMAEGLFGDAWRPTTSWSAWPTRPARSRSRPSPSSSHQATPASVSSMSLAAFRWGRMAVVDRA